MELEDFQPRSQKHPTLSCSGLIPALILTLHLVKGRYNFIIQSSPRSYVYRFSDQYFLRVVVGPIPLTDSLFTVSIQHICFGKLSA
jgi:hypothetical protein